MAPRSKQPDDSNPSSFDTVYKSTCCGQNEPASGASTSDLVRDDLALIRSKICLTCSDKHLNDWKPVGYHQQAKWLLGSSYLVTSHRPPLKSFRVAFRSAFRLHSETGNIWSHGLGAAFFAYLGLRFFSDPTLMPRTVTLMDQLMTALWFLGQVSCCSLSTVYHTFNCYSESVGMTLVKCDYVGIFASCWSTLITAGYFGYYCDIDTRSAWYGLAMVVAIVGPYLVMTENNLYRVMLYSAVVLPNITAFYRSIIELSAFHPHLVWPVIKCLLGTYGFPLVGAAIYLCKVPERLLPGRFDLVGHSHQLMHILVLGCMYSQYQLLIIGTKIRFYGNCDI